MYADDEYGGRTGLESPGRRVLRIGGGVLLALLLCLSACGCSIFYHELNTAKREGREFTWRYPHPVFPDTLDAAGEAVPDPLRAAQRLVYNDLEPILAPADSALLAACADSTAVAGFEAEFWRLRDPVPSTPANEARETHYERLAHAREHFPDNAPPKYDPLGIDARGRDFVLFGPPERRVGSEGEDVRDSGAEYWYWDDMVAAYLDINNDGAYLKWSTGSRRLQELEETYWERAWFREREEGELPADFDVAVGDPRFLRGVDGLTGISLGYHFDRSRLEPRRRSGERGFVQSVAIQDTLTREILAFDADTLSVVPDPDSLWTGRFFLQAPAGSYLLSLSVQDLGGDGADHSVRRIDIPEFPNGELAAGSIVLYVRGVNREDPADPLSPIVNEFYIPNSRGVFAAGEDVCMDFPLYLPERATNLCEIVTEIERADGEGEPYRVSKTYIFLEKEEAVASCHNGPFEPGIHRVRIRIENRSTPFARNRVQVVHTTFRVRD